MKKILQLDGHTTCWRSLRGIKYIHNQNILLSNYHDDVRMHDGPVFSNAKNVFIYDCDKNFVYRWLNNETFPVAKKIYMDSYCPNSSILSYRFDTIYAVDSYGNNMRENSDINIITEEDWDFFLRRYDIEKMIFDRNSYFTPLIE
jgi:hypothetical protein